MEILDECIGDFRSEMVEIMGALTLTFHEFQECGPPEFFAKKEPIASRRWLVDVRTPFGLAFVLRRRRSDLHHVF